MNLAEKISNAEREVMEILWSREGPVSFSDIPCEAAGDDGLGEIHHPHAAAASGG